MRNDRESPLRRLLAQHSPLIILGGLCVVLAIVDSDFRQSYNLQNVVKRTCEVSLMGAGQILVILTAGIDLSVGSVAALAGVVAGLIVTSAELPVFVGVLGGMSAGVLCGLINGVLITKGRIPPFIVTLGMMMAARGAALLLAKSEPIYGLPASFKVLGGSQPIGGASGWWLPVVIMLAFIAFFAVVLSFTRFGRALYATGGNLTGARLSGIPVDRVRIIAYTLCGFMAACSGIILAARSSIADPSAAYAYELDAIAACVIGGASLMGGEGGVVGVLAGGLIMNVLVNICNLNNISPHWQRVLVGSLIVALVYYDNVRKRKAGLLKD